MRILHLVHQFLPDHVGGTERHVEALAAAQHQAGHEVSIFCRRSADGRALERESRAGATVYRASNGRFTPAGRLASILRNPFLATSLLRVVDEVHPDVIHVHHLMGLPAGTLTRLAGQGGKPDPHRSESGSAALDARDRSPAQVPARAHRERQRRRHGEGPTGFAVVATLHDYWWVCANAQLITDYSRTVCDGPQLWVNCARCGLARAGMGAVWPLAPLAAPLFASRGVALRRLLPYVDAWIAPTAFVRKWHVARGFPADRVVVIGHGIELPANRSGDPEAPLEEGKPPLVAEADCCASFAYIGGLAPQKGVHLLIEAFNSLPGAACLTIAGDETAFPDYVDQLRSLARHDGIQFVGQLDRPAVWRTLANADALIVPSLWYETASLIVQEAFATGTPVVAAGHGALAERVRHEVDGLLVPPGDAAVLGTALRRLVEEPDLLPRLRRGIRPVTTMDDQARRVEALYHQVLETRPS